jgi:hypothetical protein
MISIVFAAKRGCMCLGRIAEDAGTATWVSTAAKVANMSSMMRKELENAEKWEQETAPA